MLAHLYVGTALLEVACEATDLGQQRENGCQLLHTSTLLTVVTLVFGILSNATRSISCKLAALIVVCLYLFAPLLHSANDATSGI